VKRSILLRTRGLPPPRLRRHCSSKVCLLLNVLCKISVGLVFENLYRAANTQFSTAVFALALLLKSLLAATCTVSNNYRADF